MFDFVKLSKYVSETWLRHLKLNKFYKFATNKLHKRKFSMCISMYLDILQFRTIDLLHKPWWWIWLQIFFLHFKLFFRPLSRGKLRLSTNKVHCYWRFSFRAQSIRVFYTVGPKDLTFQGNSLSHFRSRGFTTLNLKLSPKSSELKIHDYDHFSRGFSISVIAVNSI